MSKISKQIKNNYENMMKIDNKYQDLVTNIVCYIRAELTEYDAEEAINDINEILLGAQDRDENLFEVVGDYKVFCKSVIESYKEGVRNYRFNQFIDNLPIYIYGIVFFFSLDIVNAVILSGPKTLGDAMNINYTITLIPIINSIIGVIVSMWAFKLIAKTQCENISSKKGRISIFIAFILMTAAFVGVALIGRNFKIITLTNASIPIFIAFIIVVIAVLNSIKVAVQSRKISKIN